MLERGGAPRRRPVAGGYARGEETRSRIVEAAMRVFGEEGYERASTRRIAEEAGVKPPALQYYFDSKEGLHRACAELIVARAGALFETLREAEDRLDLQDAGSVVDGVCEILDTVIDLSCRPEPGRSRFIARMQSDGAGPAVGLIRDQLIRPLANTTARLIARVLGLEAGDLEVRLKTSVLLAQASAVHASRSSTLALLGWEELDEERIAMIKRTVRDHTRAVLYARRPAAAD
jgi:TetR/AcrR family transcriptional regulator, regulator of cefoperazone and chloramphenicol sensitivity